jgi:hypothetical protein
MAGRGKPIAWCVVDEKRSPIHLSHVYRTKAEAMWWGDFIAGYSVGPVWVMPLFAGPSKVFSPRGKKQKGPTKLWIPKRVL